MKALVKLVPIVILALVILASLLFYPVFFARPAHADFEVSAPVLTATIVSPTKIYSASTPIVFTATGFAPDTGVELLVSTNRLVEGTTDEDGQAVMTPSFNSLVSGTYTVTVRQVPNTGVEAELAISLRPGISAAPEPAPPGSQIVITLGGWSAGEVVTVSLDATNDCAQDYIFSVPKLNAQGSGSFRATIPLTFTDGTYYLNGEGASAGCAATMQ